MTIIEKSRDFSKIEEYLLTHGNNNISVKDLEDGVIINCTGFMKFIDMKGEEEVELLSFIDNSNTVYVTQSKTFYRSLKSMYDVFGDDYQAIPVRKISGTSKAGRGYVDCELAFENLPPQ